MEYFETLKILDWNKINDWKKNFEVESQQKLLIERMEAFIDEMEAYLNDQWEKLYGDSYSMDGVHDY